MAAVAKHRSVFIANIPPASSTEVLEGFLQHELELSGYDGSRPVKVIFPVSASNLRQALAIFQDEKAMVTLMRKRLVFEGELLTMQPFLSKVFTSTTAVINPDVTELFPFGSQDFSQLLEKQSGVQCSAVDNRDSFRGQQISQTYRSEQLYALTGTWYQLQNARKFLQEWMVDETNRPRPNARLRDEDLRAMDTTSPSVVNGSQESAQDETRRPSLTEKTVPGPNLEGDASTLVVGESMARVSGGISGVREAPPDDTNTKLGGRNVNVAASFKEPSNIINLGVGSAGLLSHGLLSHHQPNSSVETTHQDNSVSIGTMSPVELSEPLYTSAPTAEEVKSMEDDLMRLQPSQEITTDPTADASAPSPPSEVHSRRPEDIPGRDLSTMSSERSEDRYTVGPSLDYMRHVKVPQTPLASLGSESREQLDADAVQSFFQTDDGTLSSRVDLVRASTVSPQSATTVTDGRSMDGGNEKLVEGMGSLPVDPGVFSYILFKQSEPIREIEEKFGVKFSMHATRDNDDSDVESALLKITPTRETFEIAQAHDEFVDFYSEIFSMLHHRAISTTDVTFDPESLRKTVDMIHQLYQSVLITVTKEKVLIYGSSESDVRLAKLLVVESVKKHAVDSSDLQGPSGVSGQMRDFSVANGRVESPSAQPVPEIRRDENTTEIHRSGWRSELRGGHCSSGEVGGTPHQIQPRARGNEPVFPVTDELHSDLSDLEVDSAAPIQRKEELPGPAASFEDEAVEHRQTEDPRRNLHPCVASGVEPTASLSVREAGTEITREAEEATDVDRRNLVEEASNMANVIPVDPGVFAFIQMQKHSILCSIEQNYGIRFNVRGSLDSDVYMVEVESERDVSETAAQQGKEAFVTFYQEVFSGLEHRVVSLGEFENVTCGTMAEIIEEMKLSFSDLLFKVVGSKVLIYGQGHYNVNTAKDLICRRLRGSPTLPRSVSQFDDDADLESLSSDSMTKRLAHLRWSSLSPVSARAGQTLGLSQNADARDVTRLAHTDGNDLSNQEHLLNEEDNIGHLPSQNPKPYVGEQKDAAGNVHVHLKTLNGHSGLHVVEDSSDVQAGLLRTIPDEKHHEDDRLQTLNGYNRLLEPSSDAQSARARTRQDAKHRHPLDDLTQTRDATERKAAFRDGTYKLQDDCLILDLSSGLRVQLYCGDITELRVDAIVNAANETLSNVSGVARDIRDAAGESMQADCNRYIARHGLLYPAKVVHTGSGNLPCKFVLHAVGPKWNDYPNKQQARQTLEATVVKCLRAADEKLQVSSLAMPLISSGIFGVPLEVCIEEICKALLDVNRKRLTSRHGILHKLEIVHMDIGTVRQAQDIMINTFGREARTGSEAGQEQDETDMRGTFSEGEYDKNQTVAAATENGLSRRGRRRDQQETTMSRLQRRENISSDEDVAQESIKYRSMDDYSLPSSQPAMARSTSLPYLPGDDVHEAGKSQWAYRTSSVYTPTGRDRKESRGRKPYLTGERGREQAPRERNVPNASPKETRQERQVRELLDAFSRSPPSPELSQKTESEINRLLSEQDRGARQKQPQRPVRRSQSLDRSRPRQKCFVCSSTRNLSKRRSCEHLVCEICKLARLDVGRCRECSKAKPRGEPHERCDLCLCSAKHLLLTCRDCKNALCAKCVGKGLDTCQNCMKHTHSVPEGHAERKPPKVRQPIVGARASRADAKSEYRIKTSAKDSTSTRRQPVLGWNQSVDVVAQGYARAGGVNGSVVSNSTYPKSSAFSKEFVSEEAPHEVIIRRLSSREQETQRQISQKDAVPVMVRSSIPDRPPTAHGHSRKQAWNPDELKVIGQSSPPVVGPHEAICPICMDNIKDAKSLQCNHTFCSPCIDRAFRFKPICPICGVSYGKLQGDQPDGSMNYTTVSSDLPGHPDCGTIVIIYAFPNGVQSDQHPNPGMKFCGTQRQAYLPNNRQGQEILQLLIQAFDARLLFTIGRSVTTGTDNTVVWNDIHHKTRQTGGAELHGYPDPTYLQRVRQELETKGIK